jgi:hypothetical protein
MGRIGRGFGHNIELSSMKVENVENKRLQRCSHHQNAGFVPVLFKHMQPEL